MEPHPETVYISLYKYSHIKYNGDDYEPIRFYGYKIFDAYNCELIDGILSLEELIIPLLPQNLLETINIKHSVFFDASCEYGIIVNDQFYKPEDLIPLQAA